MTDMVEGEAVLLSSSPLAVAVDVHKKYFGFWEFEKAFDFGSFLHRECNP